MGGEPILVVDDNATNLKLVSFLLSSKGYEVRTATDASAALGALDGWLPRLILMDLQLPGMDGLALTRKLKGEPATAAVVIVAVTAYAMKGDEERARLAGCDGYVTKPIDTRALPRLIFELLEQAGAPGTVHPKGGDN